MGIVEVVVLRAKDLNRKDTFTNNDAFVDIWLDDKAYKQKTKTVQSSTPEWNQTFTFNYDRSHTLHFHVLDKDIADTDGIGAASFDFKHLVGTGKTETKELTLKAHALDLTPNGYLTVAVTVKS
ncbi:hypothetical protein HDU96_005031 [Phlyctochytrium bullatum]|nr:hypothetical protein HDU96_005031 [Phlyctochytrium bullatum]